MNRGESLMSGSDPAAIRREYTVGELVESSVSPDAIEQFGRWFNDAIAANLPEPTAMTLATADAAGRPDARIVLLKAFDASGFVFYTSYISRKGRELAENPRACLVFYWEALERQGRVGGGGGGVSPGGKAGEFPFAAGGCPGG